MPNSRSAEQIGQAADDYLAGQIGRLDDELQTMKAAAAEEIATAVERGILRAVSRPELWEAVGVAMRAQAQSATGALALLSAIQPRQFDWISTGEHQRFGFVAQELDAVFPEAVTKADDGTYSVDYSKMVPLLAAAILEMQRDS